MDSNTLYAIQAGISLAMVIVIWYFRSKDKEKK